MKEVDLQKFKNYLKSRIDDFDYDISENKMISDAVKHECRIRKTEVLRILEDLDIWFEVE